MFYSFLCINGFTFGYIIENPAYQIQISRVYIYVSEYEYVFDLPALFAVCVPLQNNRDTNS